MSDVWSDYYRNAEERFVEYFLKKGNEWGAKTQGPQAVVFLKRIQGIYGNLRHALTKAVSLVKQRRELWPLWRDTLIRLFNFYDYNGLWKEMYELLSLGADEADIMGDIWAKSVFLFFQARIDSNIGMKEQAISKSSEAIELCKLTNDEILYSSLLHFQGTLFARQNPSKARGLFNLSLEISSRNKNMGGRAATLYEIGRLEERFGKNAVAETLYNEALSIFSELDVPREKATLLFQIGTLHGDLNYLQSALQIYDELGDLRGYAQTLHQMGNVLRKLGEFSKARENYIQAIRIFKRIGAGNSVRAVERELTILDSLLDDKSP